MITFPRIAAFTLAALGLAMAEAPIISFIRPPGFIAANTPTEFRVRVPRHEDNRRLELSALEHGERVSFTARPLDGGSAPLQVFKLILPRGQMVLVATIYGADGQRARVQAPLRVLSPSDSPETQDLDEGSDE